MTKQEKEVLKKKKAEEDAKFGIAIVDGRKEKVGNYRVEPPGLFRGRGAHPKTGKLKRRLRPEDITLNLSEDAPVPPPPPGHRWGDIVHDNTVTWLATWKENINNQVKYVFLAANSSFKGQSDFKKFEKARELKDKIEDIRKQYQIEWKDNLMATRQRATALYLIDRLALRAGHEKGEDEADTVGCCSLRLEHMQLIPPRTVQFDFLGKDSIRYVNEVQVEPQVYKNLAIFMKPPKDPSDLVFDRLRTSDLNKHLNGLLPGLTAKVFRTYNASITMQQQLDKLTMDGMSVPEKVLAYNRANRDVAILCNHQRSIPKSHETTMGKMEDKIRALRYQRRAIRRQWLDLVSEKEKKKLKESWGDDWDQVHEDPERNEEWCLKHEEHLVIQEKEKADKKLRKMMEKLREEYRAERNDAPKDDDVLDEILKKTEDYKTAIESYESAMKKAEELDKAIKSQRTKGKCLEVVSAATEEKCTKAVDRINDRIAAMEAQATVREENKTTALGTSKLNYIDPRITAAWCTKHKVPLEKMFAKTLREKFKWAMEVGEDWKF